MDASDVRLDQEDRAVAEIVRGGPIGTFALAGISTALVVAMCVLFYVLVYLPRGVVQ